MVWFKVDDSLQGHPKVVAAGRAAMGLWVEAGAWCARNMTDGFVPDRVVTTVLRGTRKQVERLVDAGLWEPVEGGYQFHDWADFQPTAEDVRTRRKLAAARFARWREKRGARAAHAQKDGKPQVKESANALPTRSPRARTRPDPTRLGVGSGSSSPDEPNAREAGAERVALPPEQIETNRRGVAAVRAALRGEPFELVDDGDHGGTP